MGHATVGRFSNDGTVDVRVPEALETHNILEARPFRRAHVIVVARRTGGFPDFGGNFSTERPRVVPVSCPLAVPVTRSISAGADEGAQRPALDTPHELARREAGARWLLAATGV